MSGFPFEQDGGVGFGLEEGDTGEGEAGEDEGDPFGPAPGYEGGLADESADDGACEGLVFAVNAGSISYACSNMYHQEFT